MITLLISALGGAGILLFANGVLYRRARLEARVEPYLSGLKGRPSVLLGRDATMGYERWLSGRLGRRVARTIPSPPASTGDRLAAAGLASDPSGFRLEQFVWGFTAMIGTWLAMGAVLTLGLVIDVRVVPVIGILSFALGFLGRDWWLTRQIAGRRAALAEELPTAMDLMTLAIMAGESVPAALDRVAAQISGGIGAEFGRVVADIRAGAAVLDALEGLKRRVPISGIGRFVDALVTGIERGAPLADVLRAQADDGRESRRRYLLEAGGRREVVMLIPVVFLIMPVVVVYALLPGLVSLDLLVP